MNIIAVDDERLALRALEYVIQSLFPDSTLACFSTPTKALEYAETHRIDIAFLDIEMGGMTGLSLARLLKDIYGKTNIIFTTGHSQYALPAFELSPSGYLLKPITTEAVAREIENLRHPVEENTKPVRIQTFGHFEIFVQGRPVPFVRSRSKEILAYLVDRKGASISRKEIAAVMWGDQDYTRSTQTHLQILIGDLMKALEDAGVGYILIRQHGSYAIDTTQVSCDYYDFNRGDPRAVNAYSGEYMTNYAWAEFTEGVLLASKNRAGY